MADMESLFRDQVYTEANLRFVRRVVRRTLVRAQVHELFHHEIEDLTASTFLDAWHGMQNFRADSKIESWLYSIATNRVLTVLRKDAKRFHQMERRKWVFPKWLVSDGVEQSTQFHHVRCLEAKRRVRRYLRTLSLKHFRVMRMKFEEDMSFREIASRMRSTEATMNNLVSRIKPAIRRELIEAGVRP